MLQSWREANENVTFGQINIESLKMRFDTGSADDGQEVDNFQWDRSRKLKYSRGRFTEYIKNIKPKSESGKLHSNSYQNFCLYGFAILTNSII